MARDGKGKNKNKKTGGPNDNPVLNCIDSAGTERDWDYNLAVASGYVSTDNNGQSTVDLRRKMKDSRGKDRWEVGHQGDSGSCVGWALADGVLRWHLAQKGLIKKNERLSVRFLWMAAKETDRFNTRPTSFIDGSGTSLKAGLEVCRKYGAVKDSLLPFGEGGDDNSLYQGSEHMFYAQASRFKILNYTNLRKNLDDWRSWLANTGPILTKLTVDRSFGELYDDRSARLDAFQWMYTSSYAGMGCDGHAVAIVGYFDNYFIIRNSWGTAWGDNGYAYASESYVRNAFSEAYGITV